MSKAGRLAGRLAGTLAGRDKDRREPQVVMLHLIKSASRRDRMLGRVSPSRKLHAPKRGCSPMHTARVRSCG